MRACGALVRYKPMISIMTGQVCPCWQIQHTSAANSEANIHVLEKRASGAVFDTRPIPVSTIYLVPKHADVLLQRQIVLVY